MNTNNRFVTRSLLSALAMFAVFLVYAASARADLFPDWTNHAWPFTYLFGNHIDTHQQTRLLSNGQLFGYFYIIYLDENNDGQTDIDPVSGLPIATHPRSSLGEICGQTVNCEVGWIMRGMQGNTKFLFHNGVNSGEDHPVWMANRTDETTAEGLVSGIPQPGSYTHFHWISQGATDPRAAAVSAECNKNDAAQLEQAPSAVNKICQGWFLQIVAVRDFAFKHGGEVIPVTKGTDNATHLNIVTDYKVVTDPAITPTR
jgi:hypothetical protein